MKYKQDFVFKLWKLSFIDKPWNNSVDEKDYGCGF